MRSWIEPLSTGLLVMAALLVAAAAVHREFFRTEVTNLAKETQPTALPVAEWEELLREGVLVGDSGASIKIIEFADLECPSCARFFSAVASAKQRHGEDLAFNFIHFPLLSHRFSRPAARATECANEQGRFAQLIGAVFAKQDSLGLKTWSSYAAEAGVEDSLQFALCIEDDAPLQRIERGRLLGIPDWGTSCPHRHHQRMASEFSTP